MCLKDINQPTRVAVGVIMREEHICISLRPKHVHKGGLWEFPGGKISEGESVAAALTRELSEELGIEVVVTRPLIQVPWDYPEKSVYLEVLLVTEFNGEPLGKEGQEVRWVSLNDLSNYQFPEANKPIIDALSI